MFPGIIMQPQTADGWFFVAIAVMSVLTFFVFGFDKWRAIRAGGRVSEFTLALLGALGGWPGGLLAMLAFRHKTAKASFKWKYAAAGAVFAGLLCLWWRWR